jgi:hypothetical protein
LDESKQKRSEERSLLELGRLRDWFALVVCGSSVRIVDTEMGDGAAVPVSALLEEQFRRMRKIRNDAVETFRQTRAREYGDGRTTKSIN